MQVADCRDRQIHLSSPVEEDDAVDEDLLARLGLEDRLAVWRERWQEINAKGERYG